MANLFSRFSANIEQSQTVVEKQDNKALGALRNSLQVVKDSSEKAKAGIQSIDRTKVIEKQLLWTTTRLSKLLVQQECFLRLRKQSLPH